MIDTEITLPKNELLIMLNTLSYLHFCRAQLPESIEFTEKLMFSFGADTMEGLMQLWLELPKPEFFYSKFHIFS